jgi:hypothetical protein
MKKKFILILLTVCSSLFAQKKEFFGIVKTDSGRSFLITLEFRLKGLGEFDGRTTLDPFGPYKTITSVNGLFQDSVMIFTELGNLESDIKDTNQQFCFIYTNDLTLNNKGKSQSYEGQYIGYDLNGDTCSIGTIQLSQKEDLSLRKVKKVVKIITERSRDVGDENVKQPDFHETKIKSPTVKRKMLRSDKPMLYHQNVETLKWSSDSVTIYFKDTFDEDGDSVRVEIDDTVIEEFVLSKNGKSFTVSTEKNNVLIRIKAISEGDLAPNTMDVMLIGDDSIFRSSVRLRRDEWTDIILTKPNKK